MKRPVQTLTTAAFILACGVAEASAQQSPGPPMMQRPDQTQQPPAQGGASTNQRGGMMGNEMMGRGMMGGGMMGRDMMGRGMMPSMSGLGPMMNPVAMRILFALMDADSDGTVSLQEFQTAHERIFKAMDANKDGVLTLEEIQTFMRGTSNPTPPR
jgi:EF hand